MKKYFFSLLLIALVISGCASGPRTPEEWLNFQVSDAKASLAKGDDGTATLQIANALETPAGRLRIREFFATTPRAQTTYYASLEKTLAEISTPAAAIGAKQKLDNARAAEIFSASQYAALQSALDKRVQVGNSSGTIPFDLTTKIADFPGLAESDQRSLMLERSIDAIRSNDSRAAQIGALMAYVKEQGRSSLVGKKVEGLLPGLRIRRGELDAVGSVFQEYAASRAAEISAVASIQLKNSDRIFAEDLLDNLRSKVQGVEWQLGASPKSVNIVVERIRSDERILPERTETVTYAQHEVNMLAAVMLMPRNASYLYEVSSGGAEIEYGFVVTATVEQKVVYDELVRGKVGGQFAKCQNTRIQNVFGGVSSAGFVANDDMQRRCSGPQLISMENLRKDVLAKLSDSILRVPQIKAVHELNF